MSALRERIAQVIYKEGGYCGNCSYEGWDACAECRTCLLGYADAVLADLGWQHVGWGCAIEGHVAVSSIRANRPKHAGAEFYVPVVAVIGRDVDR